MKKIKLTILLFGLFFCVGKLSAQTYYGNIQDFTVTPGIINLVAGTTTTTINFKVSFVRQIDAAGGPWAWKPFLINFKLGVAVSGGATISEYISSVYTVSASDFGLHESTIEKTYSITVDNTKLPDNNYVVLAYNNPSGGSTFYSNYGSQSYRIRYPGFEDDPTAVWEYWSASLTDHLYTLSPYEYRPGGYSEVMSAVWKAFPSQVTGTIPIYSYWNSGVSDHFYSVDNVPSVGGGGWINEGPAFYAYDSPGTGRVPVYSYWSSLSTDHWYSLINTPIVSGQWANEGIVFYVIPL